MTGLKETLDEKRKLVDKKATQYRTTRDEWNNRTKEFTGQRNELNAEVRELIQNVKQQREIREQMNELVREKKSLRSKANSKVSKCSVVASSYTRKSLASDESLSVPSKIIEPSTTEIKPAGRETSDSELANTNGSPIL